MTDENFQRELDRFVDIATETLGLGAAASGVLKELLEPMGRDVPGSAPLMRKLTKSHIGLAIAHGLFVAGSGDWEDWRDFAMGAKAHRVRSTWPPRTGRLQLCV